MLTAGHQLRLVLVVEFDLWRLPAQSLEMQSVVEVEELYVRGVCVEVDFVMEEDEMEVVCDREETGDAIPSLLLQSQEAALGC
jgi:hypothetical protein